MFHTDDPRLTAYVLGELDGDSRAELEANLERSPELRHAVDELREAAAFLTEALHNEPSPSLTPQQRESIRAASRRGAEEAVPPPNQDDAAATRSPAPAPMESPLARRRTPVWLTAAIGTAAVVLIAIVSGWRPFSNDGGPENERIAAVNREDASATAPPAAHQSRSRAPLPMGREVDEQSSAAVEDSYGMQPQSGDAGSAGRGFRYFSEGERHDPTQQGLGMERDGTRIADLSSQLGAESGPSQNEFYSRANSGGAVPADATPDAVELQFGGGLGGGGFGGAPGMGFDRSAGGPGGVPANRELAQSISGTEGAPRPESFRAEPFGDAADATAPAAPALAPRASGPAPPGIVPQRLQMQSNNPVPNDAGPSAAVGLRPQITGSPEPAPAAPPLPTSEADPSFFAPAEKSAESLATNGAAAPRGDMPLAERPRGEVGRVRRSMEAISEDSPKPQAATTSPAPLTNRPAPDKAGEPARDAALAKSEIAAAEFDDRAGGGQAGKDDDQKPQQQGRSEGRKSEQVEETQKEAKEGDQETEAAKRLLEKKSMSLAQRTWRRVQAVPNASRLMVGDQDELALHGMQANVTIDGFRARVVLDLYFYNDRDHALEGDFKLRLPNDASLYYFAFGQSSFEYRPSVDQLASSGFIPPESLRTSGTGPEDIARLREGTWSNVKEARIVPREKAAYAYSETVRRRIDPALVEWAGAGVFNARVFPLMPRKLHHIVCAYDVNLTADGEALNYSLDLPEDVSEVQVDLNLAAVPGAQAQVSPDARPFTASGRAYYHLEGPWTRPLQVRIASPETLVLHGKDSEGNQFFATRLTPDLPAEDAAAGSPHATFLVDTSLSASPDKFNVWLKLLETTLAKNRDSMKHFAVLFFNIESHWWKEKYVENNEENVQELLNYCNTLALEGATDLRQALAEATKPSWPQDEKPASQPDLFLLSDGAITWGEQNLHLLAQTLRDGTGGTLFAYQTGLTGTAIGVLEHLARESGGAVFSIAHEDEIDKAAVAHRQRPWRLVDVTVPGGDDLLVAGRPKSIYPGQPLLVVGRGNAGNEAVVSVARGEEQHSIRIPLGEAIECETPTRLYGQVAVGQLEDLGAAVEDVAIAYARHFRVTGQTCSLLMLDNEADYQRFNIRPEDDAFVVKSSAAKRVIDNKLDELGDQLADPKRSLELWLAKLETTPGVQLQLSTAMKLALERVPAESLAVKPSRLEVKSRTRDEMPKKFFQQLESGQLDYDVVTEEAARRLEAHSPADALKAVSNLVENQPGDPTLARDVAFSAIEWGLGGQAYWLLRRVAESRPYEPQVYQALGQCAAEMGSADLAIVYYEVALGGQWHPRYQDVSRIAAVEYTHLLRRIDKGELSSEIPDYAKARLESLVQNLDLGKADLVVAMMWNTDRTDVDLHVIEPSGEECFFQHRNTRSGGELTRDVVEGYGPEMYVIKTAAHGKYLVRADYYNVDANRTQLRTKVYVTLYEDFGGRKEHVTKKTVVLNRGKDLRDVAEVFVEKQ